MPRFGKEFKMFDAILPSLTLDITDLLDESENVFYAVFFFVILNYTKTIHLFTLVHIKTFKKIEVL